MDTECAEELFQTLVSFMKAAWKATSSGTLKGGALVYSNMFSIAQIIWIIEFVLFSNNTVGDCTVHS